MNPIRKKLLTGAKFHVLNNANYTYSLRPQGDGDWFYLYVEYHTPIGPGAFKTTESLVGNARLSYKRFQVDAKLHAMYFTGYYDYDDVKIV